MGIRFSFDIGTNSIGWAVWRTGQGFYGKDTALELLASGVSIFKDGRNPKDQRSLAEMRRVPRAQRKRRDRFTLRRRDLIKVLRDKGLFPKEEETAKLLASLDPYEIRFRGLEQKLPLGELGRAIFHLNQRRGFRSNRKTDRKDNDKGKIALATKELEDRLKAEDCRTYGEFLWRRHDRPKVREREAVRIRIEGEGAKALYHFYPTRQMIRHEFETLWERQSAHYPDVLTDEAKDDIARVLFRQRDLKPPKIGKCTFVPEEARLPKALPSVEAREIYERLNHVRLNDRPLSMRDRDILATKLMAGDNLSFIQLRKALKLGSVKINYEELDQRNIAGASTAHYLKKPDHFGPRWVSMNWDEKDAFVEKLLEEPDEERLVQQLQAEYGLSEEAARNCASIPLADGYSRLGQTANRAILENLVEEEDENGHVITYAEAVKRTGWHHSDERDGVILDDLPYYGEVLQRHILPGSNDPKDRDDAAAYWGWITNPTVHIGLNQLRRIVNALIDHFGHPDQIVVELARELKLNAREKDKLERENRQNREQNEKRAKLLEEQKLAINRENLLRLRLFEEQQAGNHIAQCPYTGRAISIESLFSDEIEIDHILPVSRTLDDGMGNKVLCYRQGNRDKRNKTPYEAFGDRSEWPDILARGQSLRGKGWRFQPNAMEKFEGERDFLQRQLNETKYLSRLARIYLGKICDPDEVYVTPGKLVGLLRGKWGLHEMIGDDNRKNRDDHRHHAIDAIVIGTLTRGLINYISREAGRMEAEDLDRVFGTIDYPVSDFRDQVRRSVETIVVRHKPEHGKQGALHEDTAYGLISNEEERAAIGNLVVRKPLKALTDGEIDRIRDAKIRADLRALKAPLMDAKGKVKDVKALAALLGDYGERHRIRRIRIGKFDQSAVEIRDRETGRSYKAVTPGENHHLDIVQLRDGSWQGFAATVFDVNQRDYRPTWERLKLGGKLVMRLHKGDMVELYDDRLGQRVVKVVVQIEISSNRLRLAAHNEGGSLQKRHDDEEDLFRWDLANISKLKERGCVAVFCDPTGQVTAKRSNVI